MGLFSQNILVSDGKLHLRNETKRTAHRMERATEKNKNKKKKTQWELRRTNASTDSLRRITLVTIQRDRLASANSPWNSCRASQLINRSEATLQILLLSFIFVIADCTSINKIAPKTGNTPSAKWESTEVRASANREKSTGKTILKDEHRASVQRKIDCVRAHFSESIIAFGMIRRCTYSREHIARFPLIRPTLSA